MGFGKGVSTLSELFGSGKRLFAPAALSAALIGSALAQSPRDELARIGDAAQLPSSVPHLERLNDMTLEELGLCSAANYESHVNVLAPSFIRNNIDLQQVLSASAIVERLPDHTREYLERVSGFTLSDIATFNVNYAGSDPAPSDRLILDLGMSTRPDNVVIERDGVRTNKYASRTERLEIEGHHARVIAQTIDAVCADTRVGDLRAITGDQYLNALRAAAEGFEELYGEKSGLRDEIRRLEATLEARIEMAEPAPAPSYPGERAHDAMADVPEQESDAEPVPYEAPREPAAKEYEERAVPTPEPVAPDVSYEHRRVERTRDAIEVPLRTEAPDVAYETPRAERAPEQVPLRTEPVPDVEDPAAPHDPIVRSLEDRIGLEIAYFEPGVRKEFDTFAGSYTAALERDGSRLVIEGDGVRSEIAIDGNVRLAYMVNPVDGLDNAHRAHVYANPQGWRYTVLAVTQDPTIVAHREGPHDDKETFTTQALWTTASLPHSFEGYTSASGWDRIVDDGAPVNVANVTGEIGRSITLTTRDYNE